MATISLKFNSAEFQKKFRAHIDSDIRIKTAVNKYANNIFGGARKAMLKEFNDHPITKELREGPNGDNLSNTLNGKGNLFTFLGFYADQDPVTPIELLLEMTNMRRTVVRGNHVYFKIQAPDKKMIESVTEMTWAGISWAFAVETGAFEGGADLTHFIFRTFQSGSRSGRGLQTTGIAREDEFEPKMYMSEILGNFQLRINSANLGLKF